MQNKTKHYAKHFYKHFCKCFMLPRPNSGKYASHKLEKVALDDSVECCAPPPRWRDLEL